MNGRATGLQARAYWCPAPGCLKALSAVNIARCPVHGHRWEAAREAFAERTAPALSGSTVPHGSCSETTGRG